MFTCLFVSLSPYSLLVVIIMNTTNTANSNTYCKTVRKTLILSDGISRKQLKNSIVLLYIVFFFFFCFAESEIQNLPSQLGQ